MELQRQVKILDDDRCLLQQGLAQRIEITEVKSTAVVPDGCRVTSVQTVTRDDEIETFLNSPNEPEYLIRIYSITSAYSWARLSINAGSLERIFDYHHVTPDLCKLINCFRSKIDATEDTLCAPFFTRSDGTIQEYAYMLRYPELRKRPATNGHVSQAGEEWSIRCTVVYHQYNFETQRSMWIILHSVPRPLNESPVMNFLKQVSSSNQLATMRMEIDRILLSRWCDEWKLFIRAIDHKITLWEADILGTIDKRSFLLGHDSLTAMRYIEMQCLAVGHILECLGDTIGELLVPARALSVPPHNTGQSTVVSLYYSTEEQWIGNSQRQMQGLAKRSHYLHSRCTKVSRMLIDALTFKDSTANYDQTMAVKKLTEWAVEDSASVGVIATITFAYLSFTTVAAVMAMPFFKVEDVTGVLTVGRDFWIYLVAATVLTLAATMSWRVLISKKRRERLVKEHGGKS